MEQFLSTHLSELLFSMNNASEVNLFNSAVKLLLSTLLGSIIGYERKSKGQIAGVGTFALISAGATLAMLLSIYIPQKYMGTTANGDPGRIAAQVITGIGFLGAGAIIRMRGAVKGLTTAAGIWFVAMIGMAVGAGLYLVGIVATGLMLTVFIYFSGYEQHVNIGWKNRTVIIEYASVDIDIDAAAKILKKQKLRIADTFMKQDFEQGTTTLNFIVLIKSNADMPLLFRELRGLGHVKSVSIDSDLRN